MCFGWHGYANVQCDVCTSIYFNLGEDARGGGSDSGERKRRDDGGIVSGNKTKNGKEAARDGRSEGESRERNGGREGMEVQSGRGVGLGERRRAETEEAGKRGGGWGKGGEGKMDTLSAFYGRRQKARPAGFNLMHMWTEKKENGEGEMQGTGKRGIHELETGQWGESQEGAIRSDSKQKEENNRRESERLENEIVDVLDGISPRVTVRESRIGVGGGGQAMQLW